MIACRKDTPYTSIEAMRSTKSPARFGEGGTGSISYVFSVSTKSNSCGYSFVQNPINSQTLGMKKWLHQPLGKE